MVSHSKRGANIGYFFENKAKKGEKMKKKQEVGCASVFFSEVTGLLSPISPFDCFNRPTVPARR